MLLDRFRAVTDLTFSKTSASKDFSWLLVTIRFVSFARPSKYSDDKVVKLFLDRSSSFKFVKGLNIPGGRLLRLFSLRLNLVNLGVPPNNTGGRTVS